NPPDAERSQGGGGKAIIPRICGESQIFICFDGVHAAILELVSTQFVHQADTTALLGKINKKTRPSGGDFSKRQFQLRAAVTTLRSQHIACKTLRMNADQGNSPAVQTAAGENDGRLFGRISLDSQDREAAVLRGQAGLG